MLTRTFANDLTPAMPALDVFLPMHVGARAALQELKTLHAGGLDLWDGTGILHAILTLFLINAIAAPMVRLQHSQLHCGCSPP